MKLALAFLQHPKNEHLLFCRCFDLQSVKRKPFSGVVLKLLSTCLGRDFPNHHLFGAIFPQWAFSVRTPLTMTYDANQLEKEKETEEREEREATNRDI